MLKREFQQLLAAIQFFTRIPVPVSLPQGGDRQTQALKYFPLVGWLVGGACALAYYLAADHWPSAVAVVISIALGVMLTGALHEDGFADCCDGFGGGWDKAQVLRIMQDPRIGAYAALGLVLMLLLKTIVLIELAAQSPELVMIALLLAHPVSRLLVLPIPWLLDYARETGDSKSRSMVERRFTAGMLGFSSLFVLLPLLLLGVPPLWYALFSATIVAALMGWYFQHRLGGYSGDCLGAVQQVTEVTVYLSLLGSWTSV